MEIDEMKRIVVDSSASLYALDGVAFAAVPLTVSYTHLQGEQRQADFIDIVAWRQQAEFVSKYFQKGSLIAIEGSLQTRQYQDKNGNNRTAVEVVANNISFAGPKNSNGSNQGGSSYQNAAPSYQNAAPARPAAVEAAPSYSAGNADDFAVIDDSDDLPF